MMIIGAPPPKPKYCTARPYCMYNVIYSFSPISVDDAESTRREAAGLIARTRRRRSHARPTEHTASAHGTHAHERARQAGSHAFHDADLQCRA
eukprot:6193735-Pleurochrysis_carterae.AAC.2